MGNIESGQRGEMDEGPSCVCLGPMDPNCFWADRYRIEASEQTTWLNDGTKRVTRYPAHDLLMFKGVPVGEMSLSDQDDRRFVTLRDTSGLSYEQLPLYHEGAKVLRQQIDLFSRKHSFARAA